MEKGFFCFGSRRKTEMEKDKIFGDRKYFFLEEKKNGEGKGGKYLEKENIFFQVRRKRRKIFGEGNYLVSRWTGWSMWSRWSRWSKWSALMKKIAYTV